MSGDLKLRLTRRERILRQVAQAVLRALLPEDTFLRLFHRFIQWRAGVKA